MPFDRKTYLRSWREKHRAEIRQYKHDASGHRCPCGQPAAMWKCGWVCEKCLELDRLHWNKRP